MGKDVCPAPLPNPHLKITDMSAAPEGEFTGDSAEGNLDFASKIQFVVSKRGHALYAQASSITPAPGK